MPEGTPQPLPPEERTVGQLVGEAIRLYGRRFLPGLALGVPAATLDVAVVQFERPLTFLVAIVGGAVLLTLSYVGGCLVALEPPRERARLVRALWVGALVFLPFPLLASVFLLPGVAWLALVGLAVPVILVEGLGPRAALARATRLARADYVHALAGLATLAIVYFLARFGLFVLLQDQGEQTAAVATFLADVVVSPLLFLGAALLYVDQAARVVDSRPATRTRVRRTSRADLHPADDVDGAGRADAQVEP